jgi:hypothetical protein
MNPYSTDHIWPPEVMAAWNDMPKHDNKIAPYTETYRNAWREWCKRHPKHVWNPNMVKAYAELDRKKNLTER